MARPVTPAGLHVGRAILRRREAAHMTQGQLATYARVSRAWLSQLESGQIADPSVYAIARIARVLGTTVDELLRADDPLDVPGLLPVPVDKLGPLRRLLRFSADQLQRLALSAETLFSEPAPDTPEEQTDQQAEERARTAR